MKKRVTDAYLATTLETFVKRVEGWMKVDSRDVVFVLDGKVERTKNDLQNQYAKGREPCAEQVMS